MNLSRRCLEISLVHHKSEVGAIVGHYDWAGNPVDEPVQLQNIISAMEAISSWSFKVKILGLWFDENWLVNLIACRPEQ